MDENKCNNCGWEGSKYDVLIKMQGNMYSCPECESDMGNPVTAGNQQVVHKTCTTEFKCTECDGDAFIAYSPATIRRGKNKGQERPGWDGKILPGERICTRCAMKRGLPRIF